MPTRLKLGRQTAIRDQSSAVRFEEAHKVTIGPSRSRPTPARTHPVAESPGTDRFPVFCFGY